MTELLQGETMTFPKKVRAGGLPMQIIITGDLGSHLEDEKIDKEEIIVRKEDPPATHKRTCVIH